MTFNPCSPSAKRYRHPFGHYLVRCPQHPSAYPNGYVPEHRLVLEHALGRFLRPDEKVVHRNGDRGDNRPENLTLVSPPSTPEGFWARVTVGDPAACWDWTRPRHRQGYGVVWQGTQCRLAHRVAFELTHGPIPDGLCVCHRRDRPPCVNPAHLFLGTQAENVQDMVRKRRRHRLSAADVERAQSLRAAGVPVAEVARQLRVCKGTICREAPMGPARGERQGHAKLTAGQIVELRRRHRAGVTSATLAREFGVRPDAIRRIVQRKTWCHVADPDDIRAALSNDVPPLFPTLGGTR